MAAETVAAKIAEKSGKKVRVYDVSKTHSSRLVAEIWRVGKVVLMSPTYNNGIYLPIDALLHDLAALDVKNRTFAVAQNGTWAPVSGKLIVEKLSALKNCTVLPGMLTIKSALHASDMEAVDAFAQMVAEA